MKAVLHDGTELEFPDGTDTAVVQATVKRVLAQQRVERFKQQLVEDRAKYSPASDSFIGNLPAAAGAGMASILRAVGAGPALERFGLPGTKEEADRLDAPLNEAPGGTTGRVLGSAALLAPAALIPGANTLTGAGLIGSGVGALTTEGGLADRAKGAAWGGAGGIGGTLLARGLASALGVGKGLVEPFTKGGQERIAGRAIKRFATDADAVAQAAEGPTITGAVPTLAEATKDRGLAALQRTVGTMDPQAAEAFLLRQEANNAARLGALQTVAGQQPATSGVRKLAQIASGPSKAEAEAARKAAADAAYGAARAGGVDASMAEALQPQIAELMKRPSIKDAIGGAKRLAQEEGIELTDVGSVQGLQYIKQALDDMIGALGPKEGNKLRLLTKTSNDLKSVLDDIAPALRRADAEYAFRSIPVDRAAVGERLLNATTGAIRDFQGNRSLTANAFSRALNNEQQLLKQATGRRSPRTLEDLMTPSQMQRINAVRDELETASNLSRAANGPGSQTAKMLASQNLLSHAAGPLGLPSSWFESALSKTMMRAPQFAMKSAEERIHESLAQGLLNPKEGKRLLEIALRADARVATAQERALLARALAAPIAYEASHYGN